MNGETAEPGRKLTLEDVLEQVRQEYEQADSEARELEVLIRQSSSEVEKMSQRNTLLANKLRQMESNLDTFPRQDIKEIYTSAQEEQMRLFMMRGQLEQLQAKQESLQRHEAVLRQVLETATQAGLTAAGMDGEEEGGGSSIVRVITAQESERQRLARQMHDGPAQSLTNLILQAEICERLFDKDPDQARVELGNLKEAVNHTFQKVRGFIFDLRPMMLDDLGLVPTLRRYVQDFQAKTGLTASFSVSGKEQRFPSHTEVTAFRIVQALLNNANQHASASQVDVTLSATMERLQAVVEDDGVGFDVTRVLAESAQRKTVGLSMLVEQAEMLNGEVLFDSKPDRGTRVEVNLPM